MQYIVSGFILLWVVGTICYRWGYADGMIREKEKYQAKIDEVIQQEESKKRGFFDERNN